MLYVTGFCVVLQFLRTCDAFILVFMSWSWCTASILSVVALEVSAVQCAKLSVRNLDSSEAA